MRRARVAALTLFATAAAVTLFACSDEPSAPPLSWIQVRNATYPSQIEPGVDLPLQDGALEAPIDSGTRPRAALADVGAFGDLDGDKATDTAVFLVEWHADGSTSTSLAAVLNDGGQPSVASMFPLGQDLYISGVRVEDGEVVVSTRARNTANPDTGTIAEVTRTIELDDNALTISSETTDDVGIRHPNEIRPTWTSLDAAGGVALQRALAPREAVTFVLRGAADQQLTLEAESAFDSAILSVQGLVDDSTLISRRAYETAVTATLPATQDYIVRLISVAGESLDVSLSYTLTPESPEAGEPLLIPTPSDPVELALAVPQSEVAIQAPQPLAALSPPAAGFIADRAPARGIVVITSDQGVVYAENPDEQLETASVIKVVVMACIMHRAEQEGRLVDEWELSLMWPMITASDNDATDILWNELGGGPGVADCLADLGATGITPYYGPYWGTSTASAVGMATFTGRLAFGELVNGVHRAVALAMLTSVIDDQRWGIPAGAEDSGEEIVGVKDGWYPDDDGWRVNSVGFVSPLSPTETPYAIAAMTNYQSTMEYGIATIEGTAMPLYEALRTP